MGTMEVLQNVRLGGRQYCCINVEISSTEIPYQSRYHSSSLKPPPGFTGKKCMGEKKINKVLCPFCINTAEQYSKGIPM